MGNRKLTVRLSGIPFAIDEETARMLNRFMANIDDACRADGVPPLQETEFPDDPDAQLKADIAALWGN